MPQARLETFPMATGDVARATEPAETPGPAVPPRPVDPSPAPGTPSLQCFSEEGGCITHPLIVPGSVQARTYQTALLGKAIGHRSLVVLPTGLGKTVIAALLAAEALHHAGPREKVVVLAPTRPLAVQHRETFARLLGAVGARELYTGSMAPSSRKARWDRARIVFATPQGVANDIADRRYDLRDVALLVVDEAHRAVGDYDYAPIAKRYQADRVEPWILGITASPGATRERIDEVRANLGIDVIELRTDQDDDVAPYVQHTDFERELVELPEPMLRLRAQLTTYFQDKMNALRRMGFLRDRRNDGVSKKDIIATGQRIGMGFRSGRGNKGFLFGALLHQKGALHAVNSLEYLETQGVVPLRAYISRIAAQEKPSRGDTSFLKDERIAGLRTALDGFPEETHPKVPALVRIVGRKLAAAPASLVLVFTQYRDTILVLEHALATAGIGCERFVGQAHRKEDRGMSQDEQQAALQRFRAGKTRVLLASSVAEEGLDIPRVDLVVFYEPVPSDIRSIQRRGRTGRGSVGHVVVLVTTGTRDEAFLYAGLTKERRMRGMVRRMKGQQQLAAAAAGPVDPAVHRPRRRRGAVARAPTPAEDGSSGPARNG